MYPLIEDQMFLYGAGIHYHQRQSNFTGMKCSFCDLPRVKLTNCPSFYFTSGIRIEHLRVILKFLAFILCRFLLHILYLMYIRAVQPQDRVLANTVIIFFA